MNVSMVAHASNEVQAQACQSMVSGPSEGLNRHSGERSGAWEQPLGVLSAVTAVRGYPHSQKET